eukprot:jgi/Picsp_1/3275/NSC_06115-R1_ankyrin unc44
MPIWIKTVFGESPIPIDGHIALLIKSYQQVEREVLKRHVWCYSSTDLNWMDAQAEEVRERKKVNGLLLVACERGFLGDVKELVGRGGCLMETTRDRAGRCCMHLSAGRGKLGVVEYLWSKGVDVDVEDREGNTALHMASANGHVEVVEFLLKQGADLDAQNSKGQTSLHVASVSGKESVVDVLMQHGASASAVDDLGMVPASYAAMFGYINVVDKLMQKQQQEVNNISRNGMVYSPLHMACLGGDAVVVRLILELEKTGLNDEHSLVNDCNNNINVSPLHCAATSGSIEVAKVLLSLGSETSAEKDADGCTPLDHYTAAVDNNNDDEDEMTSLLRMIMLKGTRSKRNTVGQQDNSSNSKVTLMESQRKKRRCKIQGWIRVAASELESLLQEYDDNVSQRIIPILLKAKELQLQIDVHSAYSALRADFEFQEDMSDSETVRIVDLLRKDASQYEYYIHQPKIGSVLAKLQRLHGNLKSLGQSTLMLDAVLVKRGEQGARVKETDAMKKKALLEQLDACVDTIDRILVGNDTLDDAYEQQGTNSIHESALHFKDILIRNGIMLRWVSSYGPAPAAQN